MVKVNKDANYDAYKTDFYFSPTTKVPMFFIRRNKDQMEGYYQGQLRKVYIPVKSFASQGYTRYGQTVDQECMVYKNGAIIGIFRNFAHAAWFMNEIREEDKWVPYGLSGDKIVYELYVDGWGMVLTATSKFQGVNYLRSEVSGPIITVKKEESDTKPLMLPAPEPEKSTTRTVEITPQENKSATKETKGTITAPMADPDDPDYNDMEQMGMWGMY